MARNLRPRVYEDSCPQPQSNIMDRISGLPKDLIQCILEQLPIQDAVRTSILSRRWRYNWTSLSNLVFDEQFFIDVLSNKPSSEIQHSFESIISKVLLLHSGPILKFVLSIPNISSPDISPWISFLSKSGIKDFTLHNHRSEFQILPTYLFSCAELTNLNLFRCIFRLPPSFSGFCHLISLYLHKVSFTRVKFETFISNCPLLEALSILQCYGIQHLKIDCPSLKYLEIIRCGFKSIRFINTQNLTTVSVALFLSLHDSDRDITSNMVKVFDNLPKVETLWLEKYFIQFLAAGSVPKRLPKSLIHLERLTLLDLDFMNFNEISSAFCLIRSSPNLRELVLRARKSLDDANGQSLNYLGELDYTGCTLDQLYFVNFRNVTGLRHELEFIKFLLANAPSLETLIIKLKEASADAALRVSTELWRIYEDSSPQPQSKDSSNIIFMDRISELPKNLIECILERLTIQEAVRTSVLSRKWRYNWATLPQLVFDDRFFVDTINKKVLQEFEVMSIINKVLLLHCGPILKFVLHVPKCFSTTSRPDIDQWILFVSRNGIKVLTLDFSKIIMPYKLPSYVFSCLELTRLKLNYCTLNPPPTFRGFPNLIFLGLFQIRFEANIFETLISGSPLLKNLTIQLCSDINDQNIDAPNLRSLNFFGIFDMICLRNTPNLSVVSIEVSNAYYKRSKTTNLIKVLGCLPRIQKLTVGGDTLKFLTAAIAPKRLPTLLKRLKYLMLSSIKFNDLDEISWALCLIRSSPNLQGLDINSALTIRVAAMEPVEDFLKAQNCLDGTLNRLQIVKFKWIRGFRPEMEFIKLILARSPLLETMIINTNAWSKELMRLRRASPKAETIYMDPQ